MRLKSSDVSFGRHESFPLRFGWLTKGLHALYEDPHVFEREDATVVLGVGKNMVASIRYWLQATQVLVRNERRTLTLTPTGERMLGDSGDPYLEDMGSVWLLHWLLATNATGATAIYWFFNHFHKPEFSSTEVASALRDFVHQSVESKVAAPTLKSDAALITRMYVRSRGSTRISLEEALDSPLSLLGIVERLDSKTFRATPMERHELPIQIFGYAALQLFESLETDQLAIDQLMYSSHQHCAPGAVFRLSENSLIRKIEQLCAVYPNALRLDNTAGVHQLYRLEPLMPNRLLDDYYLHSIEGVAA
jgi:hypothetical protein